MEKFKSMYKGTEEFINNNPTFVVEKDEKLTSDYQTG